MIDAVRRKAHRTASHGGANGAMNYNPFARQRSREQAYDEENLTRTRSDGDHIPTIQEQRGIESREAAKEFGAPQHHATDPASVTPYTTNGTSQYPEPSTKVETDMTNGVARDGSDSTVVDSQEGVNKRGKFKKLIRGKHEHENTDDETLANQTSEDLSVEERKKKALKRKIPIGQQFRFVLFGAWINILLIFVPVGFAINYAHINKPVVNFIINFIAIIPLAAMLSNATEELAIRVGDDGRTAQCLVR